MSNGRCFKNRYFGVTEDYTLLHFFSLLYSPSYSLSPNSFILSFLPPSFPLSLPLFLLKKICIFFPALSIFNNSICFSLRCQ